MDHSGNTDGFVNSKDALGVNGMVEEVDKREPVQNAEETKEGKGVHDERDIQERTLAALPLLGEHDFIPFRIHAHCEVEWVFGCVIRFASE